MPTRKQVNQVANANYASPKRGVANPLYEGEESAQPGVQTAQGQKDTGKKKHAPGQGAGAANNKDL